MSKINKFEDLHIWKSARNFCKKIFHTTNLEKFSTDFRFKDQIKSSSGSIMDNIAEGFARDGNKEFIQFLYIAKASCAESRSQLYRALDYDYIPNDLFEELRNESIQISLSISNLINYLKQTELKGHKYKTLESTQTSTS